MVSYTDDEAVVDRALRSYWFEDLDEIGSAYEIHRRKQKIEITRPFQIGITVYQLAKLRMLEFYYDFLDHFVDRRSFELLQMDTDSLYMGIAGKNLDDVVRPELREEFEGCKKKWLVVGQVEWPDAGPFQTRVRGNPGYRSMQQGVLRRQRASGVRDRKKQNLGEGDVQERQRFDLEADTKQPCMEHSTGQKTGDSEWTTER